MQLFYVSEVSGSRCVFDSLESHHCIRVLRKKEGEMIQCVDGKGGMMEAVIEKADPRAMVAKIMKKNAREDSKGYHLHVIIAPTKNMDRFEWFVEKATEIGIDEISPVSCDHSERKNLRTDRLEKRMISAMKQSLKAYLPEINEIKPLRVCLEEYNDRSMKFIAYCNSEDRHELLTVEGNGNHYTILIGPEGDFSPEEIEYAINKGYVPVSLGESRLRTETAGVVACQVVASRTLLQRKKTGYADD